MNRTERLYALVEELRAVAPRPRSATWLARRFEVSARTIERDLDALKQTGVPIWAEPGRTGGYVIDPDHTLRPLAITPREALAIAVALRTLTNSPFGDDARSAAQKVLATLPPSARQAEQALAARLHRMPGEPRRQSARESGARESGAREPGGRGAGGRGPRGAGVREVGTGGGERGARGELTPSPILVDGVERGRVLHLEYTDRNGARTSRDVEPLGFIDSPPGWVLIGHCRLRDALRGFFLDGITEARLLDEAVPERDPVALERELARVDARPLM